MKYTEYGLRINLVELRMLLEYAESRNKYGKMESCIYISGGEKPKIMQYSNYSERNPIDHTFIVN